uniref:NB-ARC domain-containing protein n=1 Tax=Leersia perrieri TaxID=77586 RepID=A0A0D9XU31_9ORYZ
MAVGVVAATGRSEAERMSRAIGREFRTHDGNRRPPAPRSRELLLAHYKQTHLRVETKRTMADIVLGLTKSVVEGTVSKVQTAIEEEKQLKERVQHDLVFITDEFQMMQSFLNVVGRGQVNNNVVRTWVTQVRNLAYDVEDCIEFVIHLDKKSAWWHRLFPSFMTPVLPSCLAPVLLLDEAVADIKQIKARVEDVSQRNVRYNLISGSGSKPVGQLQLLVAAGPSAFDILIEARDVTKELSGFRDLTELLSNNDADLQVISVWGTKGDLGKTSIIRNAYNDPEISKKFGCRAWITLAHPFDPLEFIRGLLSQFYANSAQQQQGAIIGSNVLKRIKESTAVAEDDLVNEFVKEVNEKRYLIVLEDLSTMLEWDTIRLYLPNTGNGSRILVSTQQFEIASLCTGHPFQVSQLRQFSSDHGVCILFKEGSCCDRSNSDKTDRGMASCNDILHDALLMKDGVIQGEISSYYAKAGLVLDDMFTHLKRRNEKLIHLITEAIFKSKTFGFGVISVWGIAGIGKSTFVRTVYNLKPQCDMYGWVNVSSPFNLRDFSRSLLLDLHPKGTCFESFSDLTEEKKEIGMFRIKDPIHECHKLLHEHKCLVVIDGLLSTEEWDLIKAALLSGHSESFIIVITNEESVARHCAVEDLFVFNMKGLEADVGLYLFIKEVYGPLLDYQMNEEKARLMVDKCVGPISDVNPQMIEETSLLLKKWLAAKPRINHDGDLTPEMIEEAKLIIKKCGGIPKAWKRFNDRFMQELQTHPGFDSLRGLFAWMQSYFHNSPDSLKPCIFYLSIFPRNKIIRWRRLVRRWIAEGYSRDTASKSAEEYGEMLFAKLVGLSIMQQLPETGGTIVSCKGMVWYEVNIFFHEYIISEPMEENHIFTLEGHCSLTSQRTGRHLTIGSTWERDKIVFKSIDFSRLRSLTVFGKWESFFISDKMRLLRVLDLENASEVTNDVLDHIVNLPRLKFLSLRGCKMISHLPDSLGDLRQLQTLDIRHTSVVRLPTVIIKLQKLQYIRGGTKATLGDEGTSARITTAETKTQTKCRPAHTLVAWLPNLCSGRHAGDPYSGLEVPRGIKELTALHTLGVINVGIAGCKAILKELKNLTQLRKLGVSGINKKNIEELCSAVLCHRYLESLSVQFDKDKQGSCDDALKEDLRQRLAQHPNRLVLKLKLE